MSKNKYPDYTVWAVLPRPPDVLGSDRPPRWADIGVGWINADASITINLELMPTTPGIKLQLRAYEPPKLRTTTPQESDK